MLVRPHHRTHWLSALFFTAVVGCTPVSNTPLAPFTPELTLRIYHTESTRTLVQSLTQNYNALNRDLRFETRGGSLSSLLERVRAGENAYIVANQLPNDPTLWAAPLAQDGIVLVVHPENPVRNLTLSDVRRIYVGNISNWRDVGGVDLPITPYARELGADARSEFERMVLGQRRMTPNTRLMPTLASLLRQLKEDKGALAYLHYSQLPLDAAVVALNGVMPDTQTLAQSTYPLRTLIYIIGIAPPDAGHRAFISWCQSLEGQQLVSQAYVPLPR